MKKFKVFESDNKVLNEFYNVLLDINIDEIKKYYDKYNDKIDYNITTLINKNIEDIKQIYNNCYHFVNEWGNDGLYNNYKNDIGYLTRYILHHQKQFEWDKKNKNEVLNNEQ